MRPLKITTVVTALVIAASMLPAHAQQTTVFSDKATFGLYKSDSPIGTISYDLQESGDYYREFTLNFSGQKLRYEFWITADEHGMWKESLIHIPTDTIAIKRVDSLAVFESKGIEYKIPFTADAIFYESYGPVFESLMIRQYDFH